MSLSIFDNNLLLSELETTSQPNDIEPAVPADENHGIDWIGFSFDVNPNYGDSLSPLWAINKAGNSPEPGVHYKNLWMELPIGQTVAKINFQPEILKCYVHFNPSTAIYGKSATIAPYRACEALVSRLLDSLQPFVHAEFDLVDDNGNITRANLWQRSIKLTRLDCARNLYIADAFQAKKCLQQQNPRNLKTKYTFQNGLKGWGLVNKTKAEGQDKIYDKEQELRSIAGQVPAPDPRGTLFRYETELKRTRLKKYGFRTLADISEDKAWLALQQRWEACRWNIQMSEPGTLAQAISGLTFTQQCGVVEYLAMHSMGLGDGFSPSRHRHMGAIVRKLGLKLGEPIEAQGEAKYALDLRIGSVIPI